MIALFIVLGIVAFLVLIAFLRIGVSACYDQGGFSARLYIGPLTLYRYPQRIDRRKALRKKRKKRKKQKEKEKAKKEIPKEKPGRLKGFVDILKTAKKTLGRLRKRLLIKKLTIHFVSADEDPAKTALGYGAAGAVYGIIMPILENVFRIKRRDFRAYADFEAKEPSIYAKATISLAIWEVIYIIFALMPLLTSRKHRTK